MIIEFHKDFIGEKKLKKCIETLIKNNFNLVDKDSSVEVWVREMVNF